MDSKLTWGDVLRAEKVLKENKVEKPIYLQVKDPYLLKKWKRYQQYKRRYERRSDRAAQTAERF